MYLLLFVGVHHYKFKKEKKKRKEGAIKTGNQAGFG